MLCGSQLGAGEMPWLPGEAFFSLKNCVRMAFQDVEGSVPLFH